MFRFAFMQYEYKSGGKNTDFSFGFLPELRVCSSGKSCFLLYFCLSFYSSLQIDRHFFYFILQIAALTGKTWCRQ